ncbi:MAG: hypothetical protein U0168_21010 [Nannocystaceae bacterium]
MLPRRLLAVVLVSLALAACRTDRGGSSKPGERAAAATPSLACPQGTAEQREGEEPTRRWCARPDGTMHGPVIEGGTGGQVLPRGEAPRRSQARRLAGLLRRRQPRSEEHYDGGKLGGSWLTYFADGKAAPSGCTSPTAPSRSVASALTAASCARACWSKRRARRVDHSGSGGKATVSQYDHGRVVSQGGGYPSVIGIPECDEYIAKYMRCIADKVPESARQPMNDAMTATIQAWREAANGPAREGLAASCKAAGEAAAAATTAMGCSW